MSARGGRTALGPDPGTLQPPPGLTPSRGVGVRVRLREH